MSLLKNFEKMHIVENGMSDLSDSELQKKQRSKQEEYDLTVSMNADGSPMFKSTNYSIWPVQLTLNELPPYLRGRHVVVPLLWYGSKHPNMTLLLQEFASQMQMLAMEGISWHAEGCAINSKVQYGTFTQMCIIP